MQSGRAAAVTMGGVLLAFSFLLISAIVRASGYTPTGVPSSSLTWGLAAACAGIFLAFLTAVRLAGPHSVLALASLYVLGLLASPFALQAAGHEAGRDLAPLWAGLLHGAVAFGPLLCLAWWLHRT
jgi:hypothetical protein